MDAFKKELKIWGLFFKSMFVCIHMFSDLKIDELIERLKDKEDDGDNFEHWKCACTCKCGEKKEQVFALMTYLGEPTKRYAIREDVKDAVLAQAAIDKAEKEDRQAMESRRFKARYGV